MNGLDMGKFVALEKKVSEVLNAAEVPERDRVWFLAAVLAHVAKCAGVGPMRTIGTLCAAGGFMGYEAGSLLLTLAAEAALSLGVSSAEFLASSAEIYSIALDKLGERKTLQ